MFINRQAEHHYDHQAMADPSLAEETVGLLGEDTQHRGGQALRLGLVTLIYIQYYSVRPF